MPSARPPKRTRTQRAVTVVHFAKRRETTAGRRLNRNAIQADPSQEEDEEITATTAPGEETPPAPATRGATPREETRSARATPRATLREETPSAPATRGAAPRERAFLVDVPPQAEGRFRPEHVAQLLKGQ